jgi:hypothetical protein
LLQEPNVDFGFFDDRFEWNAQFDGIVNMEQAIPARKF